MNYLSVENISKSYGDKILFNDLTFGIAKGQRTALVARNGAGKTSLFRILAGKDQPDTGNVVYRNDLRIGYLDQDPNFNPEHTVIEAVMAGNPRLSTALASLTAKTGVASLANDEDFIHRVCEESGDENPWELEYKLKQILTRLKIPEFDRKVGILSGGQKKRVSLAAVLIDEPDLFILDEPTNHIDVEMIEWIEDYLIKQNASLIVVTHDRYFLDSVCNDILELDDRKLYRYKGNYAYYLEKKSERKFVESKELEKAKNLFTRELDWIRKQPKARGTKSKARVDAFDEVKEKATGKKQGLEINLDVKMTRIGGTILEIKKLNKAFGDLQIVKGFSYTFKKGEKIGIVGKNGTGKTTFLNMLMGLEAPDSGKIHMGETIVPGYYSQHHFNIKEDKRMIEVVKDIAEVIQLSDGTKVNAMQFLNYFGFPNDSHYTAVSRLSGGERRRLHLLTVLIKNPNFLILDEPTNDLDILTLNILEEFLVNYPGCLIIVSHDRYFMDKLVDHLFIFEGEGMIRDFNGNYTDFMNDPERTGKKEAPEPEVFAPVKSAQPKGKVSFKEKYEYDKLEGELEKLEEKRKTLEAALHDPAADYKDLLQNTEDLANTVSELEYKTMRWFELAEKIGE